MTKRGVFCRLYFFVRQPPKKEIKSKKCCVCIYMSVCAERTYYTYDTQHINFVTYASNSYLLFCSYYTQNILMCNTCMQKYVCTLGVYASKKSNDTMLQFFVKAEESNQSLLLLLSLLQLLRLLLLLLLFPAIEKTYCVSYFFFLLACMCLYA